MIRLNRIHIKGFKDPERVVDFEFSTENITVVFGANGCGKTTLLTILHAIFTKNESLLKAMKVESIDLDYSKDGAAKKMLIRSKLKDDNKIELQWTDEEFLQNETKSVFLGTYRGIAQSQTYMKESLRKMGYEEVETGLTEFGVNMLSSWARDNPQVGVLVDNVKKVVATSFFPDAVFSIDNNNEKHRFLDGISMTDIEKYLCDAFYDAIDFESQIADETLFETMSDLADAETIDIVLTQNDFDLAFKNKNLILDEFIDKNGEYLGVVNNNKLIYAIVEFLQTENLELLNSKVGRAIKIYVSNFIKKIELFGTTHYYDTLMSAITEFFGGNKQLFVLNQNQIEVRLKNGQKHPLSQLSHGERHLLTLLTTVYWIAKDCNFILLDEPENALNVSWQHHFLATVLQINPEAQIIVASHSPAIVHKNRNYLKELK